MVCITACICMTYNSDQNVFVHSGGYKIDSVLVKDTGELVYEEPSQGPETLHPWFIIPEKESIETLLELCPVFENEILAAQEDLNFKVGDKSYKAEIDVIGYLFDTKLIKLITGLHGAFCPCCTASEKEASNKDFIKKGMLEYSR